MKKLWAEFKTFITKGNVITLAVGLIIGAAFTAIVNAIVNNIFKPLINWIPGVDGSGMFQIVLREAVLDNSGNVVKEALILDFGAVISAIISFLITAIVLFIIVKAVNAAQRKREELQAALKKEREDRLRAEGKLPPLEVPSEDSAETKSLTPAEDKPTVEELLEQIRDILANQSKEGK